MGTENIYFLLEVSIEELRTKGSGFKRN